MAMAAAVMTEEAIQQSMTPSEEDGNFEEDDELGTDALTDADTFAANHQLHSGMMEERSDLDEDEEAITDGDAEDEEMMDSLMAHDEDDSEDEDGEGVGAVKIQPRGMKDEDDDAASAFNDADDESVASAVDDIESKDSSDGEAEAEWEAAVEGDEDEEEPANPNRCIFCEQDEENDPSEVFELYLACGVCGDNAHRQCARIADALKYDDGTEPWYCPDCVENKLVPEAAIQEVGVADLLEESLDPNARRISRDRIAGDLLPSQRAMKPDSHSVFAQLIAPDDPMDGSRLLRKRKTSSADMDIEEMITPRRKTREKDNKVGQYKVSMADEQSQANEQDENQLGGKGEALFTNGNTKKAEASIIPPRASRSLRPKSSPTSHTPATITDKSTTSITLTFRLNRTELRNILSKPPKPKKKRSRPTAAALSSAAPSVAPSSFVNSSYSQPFYSLHDREMDELKLKPYGGILKEAEADTTITLPKPEHRRQFDEARQKAEEDWKARVTVAAEAAAVSGVKKARKVSGPASQIEYIEFGQYQIDIWYAAPYPEEYSRNKALFICEFCLKYMESDIVAWRHKTKCPWKHPPGDEIYRDGKVMIFEVDGRKNPLYCQNLCLLAKLFLGSKTLYYDVEPFLFYVMTEHDEFGCHFVGYFSKEKRPSSQNNVSCILVLPIHQRKGYGHLLIDFSYLLTRVEKKTGSPEKPLSDMGLVSYRNYWRLVLCYYLKDFKSGDRLPSIKRISDDMGLTPDDVISALDALGALIRDPTTGIYAMKLKTEYYVEVIRQHEAKGYANLNPKSLVWTPYIMGRGNVSSFELGPPLNTVAPREGDEDNGSPEATKLLQIGKRDFRTFTNGDTDAVTESLGKLSTSSGEFRNVSKSDCDAESSTSRTGLRKKFSYYEAAEAIPATRFQVYPLVPGTRPRATPRPSHSRSSASRPKASPSRSRIRSAGGSSRRASAARPRSSTSRRKSGGTDRYPKGTKKADFKDADSGPGLPPRLSNQRSGLGNEVLLGEEEGEQEEEEYGQGSAEEEEKEDPDAIIFDTPATRKGRERGTNRGRVLVGLGKPILEAKGRAKLGKSLGNPSIPDDDHEIEDVPISGDLDADGEDE